jgi:glycosyltransferase involved in cell wall biosynthesis
MEGVPTVSVITPAYNAGMYLAETIRSVLAQTFGDFEMIIVDDGSSDDTAEVASRFAETDPRILVIAQPNAGVSRARNTALAASRAPLMALLDSDDVWFPTYLEQQLQILREVPTAAVVSSNAINLGGPSDGTPLRPVPPGLHRISLQTLIEVEDSVCIMSVFRREVLHGVGGFDPTVDCSEDYDFWLRTAAAGFEILFNGTPLAFYRRRPDSASADEGRMLTSIATVLRKTRDRVPDKTSPQAAAIERQLERFQWRGVASAAKLALYRGEFAAAADGFAKLADHDSSLRLRLAALAARRAPGLLLLAHRTAVSLRRGRRLLAPARLQPRRVSG